MRGRSDAARGKTPVVMAMDGPREALWMISTVTSQGRARWMIVDGAFNHERLVEFLQTLVGDGRRRRKTVFLILDKRCLHRCRPEKAWLDGRKRTSRSST